MIIDDIGEITIKSDASICYIVGTYFSNRITPSRLSIADVLRNRCGDQTLKLVRKFEKTDIKYKKAHLDLQFLKICEDHNVIPEFLLFKVANSNLRSSFTLIDFYHVLNISLISNEKELEQIKFRHLSKLKNLIPNFTRDLVATSSHDPEKLIFNFCLTNCHLAIKIFFLKDFILLFQLIK